ncbi:MAG: carboxypeptidase regulatory-like domain-containing protein [Candidatus Krumholzibacteria bacterium]|nr:carboxypeptidase regulatory-like domain-containing protein [Candidatus Krumholzibacteria bacterium]
MAVSSPAWAQFSISGIVRNPALAPVAGVQVVLSDGNGNPIGTPLILTNAAGFYTISPLPPDNYIVGFEPPSATHLVPARLPVTVGGANTTLNANLAAGVLLSGTVTDTTGVPIPNVDLKVEDRATNEVVYTVGDNTDVNGFYDIVIPAGEFDITWRAVAPGALPWIRVIRREIISTDTVIDIQMVIGVFVSGHVTRPGGIPVAEVNLDFIDATSGLKLDTPGDVTDLTGFYQVHVPIADYEVRVKPAPLDHLLGVELLSVPVAADRLLDVSLEPGVAVSGVVTGVGAAPEPEVEIEVREAGGSKRYTPFSTTDLAGAYSIVVPAGVSLTIDYIPPVPTKRAPVRVGPAAYAVDQTINVTVPAGVWLSGTVTNTSLVPAPGVNLDLKDPVTGASLPVGGDVTDAAGSFVMTVLPGTYTVEVEPAVASLLVAKRFSQVVAGDVAVAVQLDTGVVVHGNVTDSHYLGIPDYRVEAFDINAATTVFAPSAVTDATGAYAMVVRRLRTYRFTFRPGPTSGVTDTLVVDESFVSIRTVVNAMVAGSLATGAASPRSSFLLLQNHPNPFNPLTHVRFRLEHAGRLDLRVYDARGTLVRVLESGVLPAGDHVVAWDGRGQDGVPASSGIYFCRLEAGGGRATIKMVLLK